MSRKRAKLQIQNAALHEKEEMHNGKLAIFKGLAIYINGFTEPSVQELRKLIVEYGGIYHPYLDKKALVTHIITCSLTPAKVREFKLMKVVRPDWLVESVKAGTLLHWREYIYLPPSRPEYAQGRMPGQASLSRFATKPNLASPVAKAAHVRIPPSDDLPSDPSADFSGIHWDISSDVDMPLALPHLSDDADVMPSSPSTPTKPKPKGPIHDSHIPHSTDPASPIHAAKIPGYASRKSNDIAARAMANPAWRAAHTSVAPDFIEGFYKNSRLHHLSTWKAELKTLVAEAQERAERGPAPGLAHAQDAGVSMRGAELVMKNPLKGKSKEKAVDKERVIMHCDFDAFFVSAGLIDRPHLKGKPVVVCHSQGAQGGASSTSEIASASYEARKFGIKNGMSLQQARKLCPAVQTIPYEFEKYKELSLKFYTILMSHADDLQAVSVDEALIEVTSIVSNMKIVRTDDEDDGERSGDPAKQLAESIRTQVREATKCEVSIGISHNIMLARLATRRAKPAGSYHLRQEDLPNFITSLDIQDLHGFGWSTRDKAQEKLGATNLGELAKRSKATLCEALGKGTGETLYNAIRGIDERKLESDKPRKSVSCEINYGIRFESSEQAEAFIYQMAEEVRRRLESVNSKGRSLTLKVMKRDPSAPVEPPKFMGHGLCLTYNKQSALVGPNGRATSDDKAIGALAWKLLKSLEIPPHELRGLGIQIQKLEDGVAAEPGPGQARLPFKPMPSQRKAGPSAAASTSKVHLPEITVVPTSQEDEVLVLDSEEAVNEAAAAAIAGKSLDLPNFSQVDMSVFEALPDDVRRELEAEYKRRSASPTKAEAGPSVRSPSPAKARPGLRVDGGKSANWARITHQLAPRSKPLLSPRAARLFAVHSRPAAVRVTDEELQKLSIDPEVFSLLPVDVQREQLAQARGLKGGGVLPTKPTKPLKPPKRIRGFSQEPCEIVPPPPPPKARYITPPVLRQPGPEKGTTLAFSEGEDIQRLLGQWVEGFKDHAPHSKDVEYFAKFLVRSTETDDGLEKAVCVMRWWGVLLRRMWGIWEYVSDSDDDDDIPEDQRIASEIVGRAWWQAYRDVTKRMDEVTKKRFGGTLSLR
ncbi:DNA repair protein [Dentipellis sp. KUC8613]|nr:DNA repair protein [Dentipellis sp. KUC8613]